MKRKVLAVIIAAVMLLPLVFAALPTFAAEASAKSGLSNTPSIIGSQYRFSGDAGIRFLVRVAMYNDVNNSETIEKMGMLIIPSDKLNSASELKLTENGKINGVYYLDIKAKYWYDTDEKTYMEYTAVLVGIPNEARQFAAVAYILYKDGSVVYSEPMERSIAGIKSGAPDWTALPNTVSGEGSGKITVNNDGSVYLDNPSGGWMAITAATYNKKIKVDGLEIKLNIQNLFTGTDAVWLPNALAMLFTANLSADKATALVPHDINGDGAYDPSSWINPMSGNRTGVNTKASSSAAATFTLLNNGETYAIFGGMISAIKVGYAEVVTTAVENGKDFILKFKLDGNSVKLFIDGIDIGVSFLASDVVDADGKAYLSFTNASYGTAHLGVTVKAINEQPASSFNGAEIPEPPAHLTEVPEGYVGVYTKADLNNVRSNLSGNYILMNDIEFTAADYAENGSYYNGGKGFAPIGSDGQNAFTGIFDGNGYAIKNLYIRLESDGITPVYAGLFGYLKDATVKNLGLEDGKVAAYLKSGETPENASAVSPLFVGGIAGYVGDNSNVTDCYNSGNTYASYDGAADPERFFDFAPPSQTPDDSSAVTVSSLAALGTKVGSEIFLDPMNVDKMVITGFKDLEANGIYYRLNYANRNIYNTYLQGLAWHTSGGKVRFRTDAATITIEATMNNFTLAPNMDLTATAGMDVHSGTGEDLKWVWTVCPDSNGNLKTTLNLRDPGVMKDIVITLPIFAGISSLKIGLPETATLGDPTPRTVEKPIVFYGSSITHGACSSSPSKAYVNMLATKLDADIINLGFNGSAHGESYMAEYIAGIDMSAFVMDYDHNSDLTELAANHYNFYKTVRDANPDVPIIMVSKSDRWISDNDIDAQRCAIIKASYDKAIAEGDENVYFVNGIYSYGTNQRDWFMADGCHPNDLGMYYMAANIYPTLKAALKEYYC
ncbi:MAG: hypothetical protein IKA51_04985 [Clostridia bacterium]|nr:hypothetical protein [Clostridia bacterium]